MVKPHKHNRGEGFCKLCSKHALLKESHIHPRLAYKRFAYGKNGTIPSFSATGFAENAKAASKSVEKPPSQNGWISFHRWIGSL
jgi:hypothetical protein